MGSEFVLYYQKLLEEFGYCNNTKSKTRFLYRKHNLSAFLDKRACSISDSWTSPRVTIILFYQADDKCFSLLSDFVLDLSKKLSNLVPHLEPSIYIHNNEEIIFGSFYGYVYKQESEKIKVRYVIDFERLEYNIEVIPIIQK